MHFPELWEEDSLLFDDTAERELLLRQFEELIGEISSDEGYNLNSEKDLFPFLQNEKGKVKDNRDILGLPTLFSTPPTHQQHGIRDWQLDRTEAFNRKLLAEGDHRGISHQGNVHQQTRRYDVPLDLGEKLSPSDNHLVQGSPLKTEDSPNQPAFGMPSLRNSPNPDVVGIVKLPDGNYYMAMSDSPKRGPCFNDRTKKIAPTMNLPSKSVEVSRSGPSNSPSLDSLSHIESAKMSNSDGQTGRFTPKKLFSSVKDSRKNNATRTPRKRARTYPYQPNLPPRASPPPSNDIPQDIMKDLAVIRIHRRSSYADGDSLVEVQPSSLPGSPTMFAYRDPEGRIRVPLDMHCNQKALATYRCMTPSKTAATKTVSVCDMTQRLPIQAKGTVPEKTLFAKGTVSEKTLFADSGSQRVGSTQGPEVIHQLMTSEETDHGVKEGSLSTQTIMKEWEKLRQNI